MVTLCEERRVCKTDRKREHSCGKEKEELVWPRHSRQTFEKLTSGDDDERDEHNEERTMPFLFSLHPENDNHP